MPKKTLDAVDNKGRRTKVALPDGFHAAKVTANVAIDGLQPMSLILRAPAGTEEAEQKFLDAQLQARADEGWKVTCVQRIGGSLGSQAKYLVILVKMKQHKCQCALCKEFGD